MAASVLKWKRAVEMSVFSRTRIRRDARGSGRKPESCGQVVGLESRLDDHDAEIQDLLEAIREPMAPPPAKNRHIGFEAPADSAKNKTKAVASRNSAG
jgi:hypothetical protein